MALQPIGSCVPMPGIPTAAFGLASILNNPIDASGEKFAAVVHASKTGTLEKVAVRFGTVPSAQDIKVSFQDLDAATGDPDGTVDQFRVIPSASVVANTWFETGIISSDGTDGGTKRSVTMGQDLFVVFEFDSTVGSVGFVTFDEINQNFPYVDLFTTSWVKDWEAMAVALKYDDGTYAELEPILPIKTVETSSHNSGSTPDEIGNITRLSYKARAVGIWLYANIAGDSTVILYDSDGSTVLGSKVIDKEYRASTSADIVYVRFSAPVTLLKDTDYRITLRPDTATAVTLNRFTVDSTALMAACPLGANTHSTHRTDARAWTEVPTERAFMGLLIDQLSDDVGAGGGPGPRVMQVGSTIQPVY